MATADGPWAKVLKRRRALPIPSIWACGRSSSRQLDFYGYDEGDLSATVTFTIHPPSGRGQVLLTDEVFIGEDAAGGGTYLDASVTYDLCGLLGEYEAHPQQGYHVKVTVEAEGSVGADTKHKVFWVTDCGKKDCPPKY